MVVAEEVWNPVTCVVDADRSKSAMIKGIIRKIIAFSDLTNKTNVDFMEVAKISGRWRNGSEDRILRR